MAICLDHGTNELVGVVAPNGLDVDHKVWTPAYTEVVKTTAEDPSVTRIFAHPWEVLARYR
jgi:murein endopeptidase